MLPGKNAVADFQKSRSDYAAFAGIPSSRQTKLVHSMEEVRAISIAIKAKPRFGEPKRFDEPCCSAT